MPRSPVIPCSLILACSLSLLACLRTTSDGVQQRPPPPPQLTVMSRNLYLGADLRPAIAAPEDPEMVERVFASVVRSNMPGRMAAIAAEIAETRPAVIGLQEAVIWKVSPESTPGGAPAAGRIELDAVQLLLEALRARHQHYELVATSQGMTVSARGQGRNIELTDREAILVRRASGLSISSPRTGRFATMLEIPAPSGPIAIPRSWAAVDLECSGRRFRFLTTHLELLSPGIQMAQARELRAGPAATDLPLIMVGDFNSAAAGKGYATPTYASLLRAGFVDGWSALRPGEPGLTGCQPKRLDNHQSRLRARIDLVLTRGRLGVTSITRTGDQPRDIAPGIHWASDHAGLVARIRVP